MSTKKQPIGGKGNDRAAAAEEVAEQMRLQFVTMQLKMQQMEQQMEQQQLLLQQQQQQQQQHSPLPPATSASSAPPPAPAPIASVRMPAVQPGELTYQSAGEASKLADWLFKVEQLLSQLGKANAAWEDKITVVSHFWDRELNLWWTGRCDQAKAAKTPIESWAAFRAALYENFVPTNDMEAAASELLKLRMRSGETMGAYVMRAALLVARADKRMSSDVAARATLDGVDHNRFPFTVSQVGLLMQKAPVESPLSFSTVTKELALAAQREPQLGGRNAPPSSVHTQPRQQSNGGANTGAGSAGASHRNMSKQQLMQRVSALEHALQHGGRAGSDTEEVDVISASPVSTKPPMGKSSAQSHGTSGGAAHNGFFGKCNKCGEAGHRASECRSSKELRNCLLCHKPGHLVAACPQRSRGDGPEGAAAAPRSKNE